MTNSALLSAGATHLRAAASSTPFIDWGALRQVAAAAFVFLLAVVILFSVGILGLSLANGYTAVPGEDAANVARRRAPAAALACSCFVICAAAVLYGLWIIIPQFHR